MKTSTKSILSERVEVIGPADCVGAVASHIETTISGPAAAVQPLKPVLDDPPKQCSCPNCDWTGTSAEMKRVYPDIPDLSEQMDTGEECPVGECPKCGALCHEDELETVSLPVAQAAEIAKLRAALDIANRFIARSRNASHVKRMAGILADAAGLADETAKWLSGDESYNPETLAEALTKLAMDCREASNKVQSLKVVIEVSGGVAEVTTCPAGVEVEIVDHDNEGR